MRASRNPLTLLFGLLCLATDLTAQEWTPADSARAWAPVLPKSWPPRLWALVGPWTLEITRDGRPAVISVPVTFAPESVPAMFPDGLSHLCNRCLLGTIPAIWQALGVQPPSSPTIELQVSTGNEIGAWIGSGSAIVAPRSIWLRGTWQEGGIEGRWPRAAALPADSASGTFRFVKQP